MERAGGGKLLGDWNGGGRPPAPFMEGVHRLCRRPWTDKAKLVAGLLLAKLRGHRGQTGAQLYVEPGALVMQKTVSREMPAGPEALLALPIKRIRTSSVSFTPKTPSGITPIPPVAFLNGQASCGLRQAD